MLIRTGSIRCVVSVSRQWQWNVDLRQDCPSVIHCGGYWRWLGLDTAHRKRQQTVGNDGLSKTVASTKTGCSNGQINANSLDLTDFV